MSNFEKWMATFPVLRPVNIVRDEWRRLSETEKQMVKDHNKKAVEALDADLAEKYENTQLALYESELWSNFTRAMKEKARAHNVQLYQESFDELRQNGKAHLICLDKDNNLPIYVRRMVTEFNDEMVALLVQQSGETKIVLDKNVWESLSPTQHGVINAHNRVATKTVNVGFACKDKMSPETVQPTKPQTRKEKQKEIPK